MKSVNEDKYNLSDVLARTMLLDLETTRAGRIYHVGAICNERVFESKEWGHFSKIFKRLDEIGRAADFVLGHNLLGHDFPILKTAAAPLKMIDKPVIDTLYLSPLAFPQNPYHRLVKDYKLVRSSLNDPVADAKLAASVFEDQWHRFASMADNDAGLLSFYHFCFKDSLINGFSGNGLAAVFSALGAQGLHSPEAGLSFFEKRTAGIICTYSLYDALFPLLQDPVRRPSAAYCLAWLQVSGSNSVLPPWVRHRIPEISQLIQALRDHACENPTCSYCQANHDPELQLKRFFGFESFRQKPSTPDGKSLQREIVVKGMNNQPMIAILPTGGGKSICYQIPALLRHFRTGALTIVISPLQALMKDQVDNLVKNTGTPFAEAIYGLQTPPERGFVMERIRLGDVAVLYLSPEQLRSRSVRNILSQREIGCWVFDEAHCLSKWGHDFRPDYLYVARFIREFAKAQYRPVPPVCGYTATAKKDVLEDISLHFRDQLGQDLKPLEGGVKRDNLTFDVIPVENPGKYSLTYDIVREQLQRDENSSVIVYAAKRKNTEAIRDFLKTQGVAAEAFHGGLDAMRKRDIIESFVNGDFPVICATNAFGMGIDKSNIRLVLHFEMPGSLENYIQEAGRAGRDRAPARCVLLYSQEDAESQFGLGALSQIKKREIERILRALRRAKKNEAGEIVVTSDELIRDDELADLYENRAEIRDTKVKAAVAWLERSGFLKRNHNLTDVFQGVPIVSNMDDALKIIAAQNLHPWTAALWRNILLLLFNHTGERGLSADQIAEQVFRDKKELQQIQFDSESTPSQLVIRALHDMAGANLLDRGIMLAAILRPKGKNNAMQILRTVTALERKVLDLMQEAEPDADDGQWVDLDLRRLNQRLKNEGYETSPHVVGNILKGLSMDGKGMAASKSSIELFHKGVNRYGVKFLRDWEAVKKIVFKRHNIAHVILETLIQKAEKALAGSEQGTGYEVNLPFSSSEMAAAIQADLTLRSEVKDVLSAIDRGLLFLHEHKAITLQGGMAVLRQAMTIQLEPDAKRRRYSVGDFKPLAVHYSEKRFQVHVMMEYAELGMQKISNALYLVFDYFEMGRDKFINKYFSDRKELIEKAVSQDSYRRVVEKLGNPVQISAVGSPLDKNLLILAGPGSGKTTVIVHRCAYLLLVERVPARQILVLCFNHNAGISLRKRLFALVGKTAGGLRVATYHNMAMNITGHSIREMVEAGRQLEIDFDQVIKDAVNLLKGNAEIAGIAHDQLRDQLLGGYSHILVDEYQDIDQDQYDLVSAIAGRSLGEGEGKLSIMAVGDDDQNIYAFRGANVEYIRQFKADYSASVVHLVENYRSSKHIIDAANQLIRHNRDRMKGDHPIKINRERTGDPPGGRRHKLDSATQGRVRIINVKNSLHQAVAVYRELDRLKHLDPKLKWGECAVLARTRQPLNAVRSVLEKAGFPIKTVLDKGFPFQRVRETVSFIDFLKARADDLVCASNLFGPLAEMIGDPNENIWRQMLEDFLTSYQEETADAELPAGWAVDRLYEFVAEQKRDKTLGRGIFLSTIHAAKGMEFAHVIILDGDWRFQKDLQRNEEERRILYVGMTRAKETLALLSMQPHPNLFLKVLKGDHLLTATDTDPTESGFRDLSYQYPIRQYELLGLNDMFVDYAGRFGPRHAVHEHLANLKTGDHLFLRARKSHIELQNSSGYTVAALSSEAALRLMPRLENIREARVVAMLCRNRSDPDEQFRQKVNCDRWELPLVEIVFN